MRILVDPSAYDCANLGDLAMLQVAVARLHRRWPTADIRVLTDVPETLVQHCPEATPISATARRAWTGHAYPPRGIRTLLSLHPALVGAYRGLVPRRGGAPFEHELNHADLVVLSGGGGTTDFFPWETCAAFDLVEHAARLDIPTAIFGQAFGPLSARFLRRRATAALPRVDLIALREERASRPLLTALGVSSDRVITTGDDAIAIALGRPVTSGEGLGVSLRVASYAEVGAGQLRILGDALTSAATRHRTQFVPIPISRHPDERDAEAIALLLSTSLENAAVEAAESPAVAVELAARCRVVVTGSYHAAVFALTQGIPAVGLAASDYYVDKFLGLCDQFGKGCFCVGMHGRDFGPRLRETIDRAWADADDVRGSLRAAATRQVEQAEAVYDRVAELVEGRSRA